MPVDGLISCLLDVHVRLFVLRLLSVDVVLAEVLPYVWQSIIAVTTGAPAVMAVVASLLNGVPRGILALPEYLIFRVLRAYFTLESMLSILVDVQAKNLERAIRLDLVPDRPIRVACPPARITPRGCFMTPSQCAAECSRRPGSFL